MKKTFKHRKTGEITTYEDGILKSSGFCVEIGVEPSSEFWEEIIERDFEILSWYFGDMHITANPDGSAREYFIHSIKRLNDGEVFTVGDKITGTLSLFEPQKGYVKITGFRINNNKLEIEIETGVITDNRDLTFSDGSKGSFSFLTIKKHKSLFTTEDGYEIFLGDGYYYVDENYVLYEQKKAVTTSGIAGFKYFKEKTNAEWYIFQYKPVLSYNDVWHELGRGGYSIKIIVHGEELRRLVKSKL